MQTKTVLTTLLAIAVLAVPATVPASQPSDVRLNDMAPVITLAPATTQFAALLGDPSDAVVDLAIVLPVGFTTLEWINQDPFAL
jgi:hypothetical protein